MNGSQEIFKLVVSCFEKLHDKSSRSYNKRATVLETVAKVRSCLLMLDLECDALILEMFQHFLNSLRYVLAHYFSIFNRCPCNFVFFPPSSSTVILFFKSLE